MRVFPGFVAPDGSWTLQGINGVLVNKLEISTMQMSDLCIGSMHRFCLCRLEFSPVVSVVHIRGNIVYLLFL